MSTTDPFLRDKSNTFDSNLICNNKDNSQYSNLNLNGNQQPSTLNIVQSKSISKNNGRTSNGKKINVAVSSAKKIDFADLKNDSILLNEESLKPFESLNLNDNETNKEENQKRFVKSDSNKSTLSLHISAYENSASNLNSDKDFDKTLTDKKNAFGKSIKNIFMGATIQNPFEFPRQQKEGDVGGKEPEIVQFQASQALLNPNGMQSESNNTITINSVEEEAEDAEKEDEDSDIEVIYVKTKSGDVSNEVNSDGQNVEIKQELPESTEATVPSTTTIINNIPYYQHQHQQQQQQQQEEEQQQQQLQQRYRQQRPIHHLIQPQQQRQYPQEFNRTTTFIQTNPLSLSTAFRARWEFPQMFEYGHYPLNQPQQHYGFVNSSMMYRYPIPMNIPPPPPQPARIAPWHIRLPRGPPSAAVRLSSGPLLPLQSIQSLHQQQRQRFINQNKNQNIYHSNSNNNIQEQIQADTITTNEANVETINGDTVDSAKANQSSEAPGTSTTPPPTATATATATMLNEELQMPHYHNITEQMPDNDDFVHSLLTQMGQQFRAEPVVPPIRLRVHPKPLNTELERVEPHRLYQIGNDKRGKSQARVWIDTPNDDTKVFLYRHSEEHSGPNLDVFVCIQCSRHNRVTKFEIRRIENEEALELWEQPTHYPSCYRSKAEIEAIQARYDKRRSSMNGIMNGAGLSSNENSFNTSANGLPTSRLPGRPKNDYHYAGHRVVPETDYVFGVNEKGSLKTRILVRDENNHDLGRVYSFHPAKRSDGRTIFYCRNCNPKKYVPVTVGYDDDGVINVREAPLARHELNCEATPYDELIEKQKQLEEKLIRKGVPMFDFSNISENADGSILGNNNGHRSPTIALSREVSRSPSVEPRSRSRTRSRSVRSRTRSRSRSPIHVVLNTSNSSGSARRGRRPVVSLMRTVPNNLWRCEDPNNLGPESKLFIFTDLETSMGREFRFCEFGLEGGAFFNCLSCQRLTANRQRTKGFLIMENDSIVVKEGRHYPTCRPYPQQDIPNPLPENERPDEIPMVVPEEAIPTISISRSSSSNIKPVAAATVTRDEESSSSLSPELGQLVSSSSKKRDDTESLPTPPPSALQQIKQSFPSSIAAPTVSTLPLPIKFTPIILPRDRTVFYNVPSSSQMRNASRILGVEYNKDGQVFWSNTMQWISEFRGISRPTEVRAIQFQKFSGFASLAIFFTGNEEYGFEMQQAIKTYFFQNFVTGKSCQLPDDVVCETLVSNELTDIHLAIFARMTNCIIGVFDGPHLKMYGASDDEHSPTMLLKKTGKIYSPVTNIAI